jgi:manganese efflux pump family protein
MLLVTYILFAFVLSLVPFSVALSSSVYRCIEWKEALRIALILSLFQAGMLMVGWVIGYGIKGLLHSMAVPVAVLIILFIGVRYFLDAKRLGRALRTMAEENSRILLGFAFVISINSLLLGMGLGILYTDILSLAGLVFAMVFFMTIIGIRLGKRGMMNLGNTAEMSGGLFLIIISIVIILQYLKII